VPAQKPNTPNKNNSQHPIKRMKIFEKLNQSMFDVGWHGSVAMPAPFASGAVRLAKAGGSLCRVDAIAVGMADCRGGLATVIGFSATASSGLKNNE